MRWINVALLTVTAAAVQAQVSYPPSGADAPNLSSYALRTETAAAQARADAAMAKANAAVQSVNGVSGVVSLVIPSAPDLSPYALKTQVPDVATLMPRAEAQASIATLQSAIDAKAAASTSYTKSEVNALLAPVSTNAAVGANAAPFARIKWAGQNLTTSTAGVATISVPAGRMTTGLSVSGLVVHTAGQFTVPVVTATGTPAAGYTVTITFSKAKTGVTVPAVVIGAAAVNLSLFEAQANTGVVSFDIGFAEPDVIG